MDTDAAAYITAVEAADTESLETYVKNAIDAFVVGCKSDSIWTPIKASCLLAGPRTLAGALVPLVGSAPTNVDGNFVSGDYNRLTGLKGNGTNKRLDSNRNNNADPQNSKHLAVWLSEAQGADGNFAYSGCDLGTGRSLLGISGNRTKFVASANSLTVSAGSGDRAVNFLGVTRSDSAAQVVRFDGANESFSVTSETPLDSNIFVFSRTSTDWITDARIAFYSIGESLDLAKLDTRIAAYLFDIANPPEGNPIAFRKRLLQRRGWR